MPLVALSALYVCVHSILIAHKEQRFLQPIVPLYCIVVADAFVTTNQRETKARGGRKQIELNWRLLTVCASGVAVGLLLCLWVQRAPITVMSTIVARLPPKSSNASDDRLHALFLTPCHSTPYYAHVHDHVRMRFLTCEQNFNHKANYVDEAEAFYAQPLDWTRRELLEKMEKLPRLIIMYEQMWTTLGTLLADRDYYVCDRLFHSLVTTEARQSTHMIVACLRENE